MKVLRPPYDDRFANGVVGLNDIGTRLLPHELTLHVPIRADMH